MLRSELFGLTDFLANCGGLLGVFLGFSFLSLVEIFYFFTLRYILKTDDSNIFLTYEIAVLWTEFQENRNFHLKLVFGYCNTQIQQNSVYIR